MRYTLMPKNLLPFCMRVLAYVGLLFAVLYFMQDRLLYFPERMTLGRLVKISKLANVVMWPTADEAYKGFLWEPLDEGNGGTVVVFHGNAGDAVSRTYYSMALGRLGYRVLLLEYPGYGGRDGKLGEESFVADACETVRMAHEDFGRPIYFIGESLGAGVASATAASCQHPVDGIALITPWDALPDLAQSKYWFLPIRWIVKDQFDSVSNLRSYPGPVAILLAEQDTLIPPKHAERLYSALPEPKQLWTFADSDHNNWPSGPNNPWWHEVMEFLNTAKME